MSNAKPKKVQGITPKGVFKFPKLSAPDYGTKEYPKEGGEYNVRLVLTEAQAQPLIDKLQPEFEKAEAEAKEEFAKLPVATRKKLGEPKANMFYTEIYDKETEEPTGELEFRFVMKASGVTDKNGKKTKWERKPTIFDAKGKPITKKIDIWGGTLGKVGYVVSPYFINGTASYGIKLLLDAVQIIDLKAGGSRDAASYGFGVEDGFDADDVAEFGDETEGSEGEGSEGGENGSSDTEDF